MTADGGKGVVSLCSLYRDKTEQKKAGSGMISFCSLYRDNTEQ